MFLCPYTNLRADVGACGVCALPPRAEADAGQVQRGRGVDGVVGLGPEQIIGVLQGLIELEWLARPAPHRQAVVVAVARLFDVVELAAGRLDHPQGLAMADALSP